MYKEDLRRMSFDHFVNFDGVKIVCARNGKGMVRIFRLYDDGLTEVYELERFIQLDPMDAQELREAVSRARDVPVVNGNSKGGLLW